MERHSDEKWDIIIKPQSSWFSLNLSDFWKYRDLCVLLIKRDFIAFYKQTVLGPIWFFLQPVFVVGVYVFLFGNVAKISTDDIPQPLFYLIGITTWSFFSEGFRKTSTVLLENAPIFGKVYFPRLIMPIGVIASSFIRYGIQLLLLVVFLIYFVIIGYDFKPNVYLIFFPILVLLVAAQGLGLGLIVSSITIKYRDVAFLVNFGLQLVMYATTVVYPLSSLGGKAQLIVSLHPLTYILEGMRLGLFGQGIFHLNGFLYVSSVSLMVLIVGVFLFNRAERNFVDSV